MYGCHTEVVMWWEENCQRTTLLKGLGSTEHSGVSREECRGSCNRLCPLTSLVFFRAPSKRTKRPRAVRKILTALRDSLEERLTQDRDKFIENNPDLLMLPKSVVWSCQCNY